jgi:hypothetical protein
LHRVRFSAAITAGRLLPQRMASRAQPLLDRIALAITVWLRHRVAMAIFIPQLSREAA